MLLTAMRPNPVNEYPVFRQKALDSVVRREIRGNQRRPHMSFSNGTCVLSTKWGNYIRTSTHHSIFPKVPRMH